MFYAPHQILELQPRARFELQVVADPGHPSVGPAPQWTSFVVQTDAPPALLAVTREIRSRDVEIILEPSGESLTGQEYYGVVGIEVGEPVDAVGFGQTYELRIVAPGDGFAEPHEIEIELAPLRFRVAASEAPIPCDALTVMAQAESGSGPAGRFFSRLFPDVTEYRSGRITLRSSRFGVGMRLLAPYRFRVGELRNTAWDPAAQRKEDTTGHPPMFVAGMGLVSLADGFEQTFDLGWFDDLEFLAHAPGCEPRRIRCSLRGGCSSD
ncbi:MAG: hypothetical protein OXP70_06040 [Acidobacteriota bacterium]|nr:hypothetical protein [Acidobacteriota bacterium]